MTYQEYVLPKGCPTKIAVALITNTLASSKLTSVFTPAGVGGGSLHRKRLQIRNLVEMDRFCSKLVSSGQQLEQTNTLATTEFVNYESIMFFIVQVLAFLLRLV
jgi:hypothetical protein